MQGERFFDVGCLTADFFLASEETAFQMSLLRECASFLVVGAVPFATFAEAYNRRFDYGAYEGKETCRFKRMRRFVGLF